VFCSVRESQTSLACSLAALRFTFYVFTDEHPFKGDVDLDKLQKLIDEVGADKIPYVAVAGTVNMAGGQPQSMANMRAVRQLCNKYSIPMVLDATRAVENAYFIQQREADYQDKSVAEILKEYPTRPTPGPGAGRRPVHRLRGAQHGAGRRLGRARSSDRRPPLPQAGAGTLDHPAPGVHPGAHGRGGRVSAGSVPAPRAGAWTEVRLRAEVPALFPGQVREDLGVEREGWTVERGQANISKHRAFHG
jgi:hypothetical protein